MPASFRGIWHFLFNIIAGKTNGMIMARPSSHRCSFSVEMNVSNPALARIVHPIADRQIVEKGGKITINTDPSNNTIKRAWENDPSATMMHVFIDKDELARHYPSIDPSADIGSGFSFDQLNALDAAAIGKNSSTLKGMARENGGWIVLRAADKAVKGSPCYPHSDTDACNIIGILGKLQDGNPYNIKKSIDLVPSGKDFSVPWQDIDARVADLEALVGARQGSIDPADYSTSVFIEFPINLWVRQSTGIDKAAKMFKNEAMATSTGRSSRVTTIDDFETWASNVMNDGNGPNGVVQYLPFRIDTSIKKNAAFIKQDHIAPSESGAKSTFQQACPADPVIVLVDHRGNVVQTEEMVKGKHVALPVANVIGKASKADLARWQWACALGTPRQSNAIILRQVPFKRSLDMYRTGPRSAIIPASSIARAAIDAARVAWNAMITSEINAGTPAMDAGTRVLARARATSGRQRSRSMEQALFSRGDARAMQGSNDLPVFPGRKSEPRKNGITGEMASVIKQGHVVGIETDIALPCNYP